MKKNCEREKAFGKKTTPESSEESVCLAHKENNLAQDSSRGRGGRRGEEDISKAGGQTLSRRKGRFALHSLQKKWTT